MKSLQQCLLKAATLTAVGLTASMLNGQAAPHTVSAAATQKQISIDIPLLGSGLHWAVALEPQDALERFTVAADTVLAADPVTRPHVGNEAIQPILNGYQISDSVYRLQSAPTSNLSVFLDVHLPSTRAVSISYGGNVVFIGKVAGPTLLIDGQVDPKSSLPKLRGQLLLMTPWVIPDELGPDLRADFAQYVGGTPQASTAGLRRHLISLPPISIPLDGQALSLANGQAAQVVARIHINSAGAVTDVQIEQGDGPLASGAQQALQGATFKPFTQDGKDIDVNGIVEYTLSDNGKLLDVSIK
jgi:hypothetical protein